MRRLTVLLCFVVSSTAIGQTYPEVELTISSMVISVGETRIKLKSNQDSTFKITVLRFRHDSVGKIRRRREVDKTYQITRKQFDSVMLRIKAISLAHFVDSHDDLVIMDGISVDLTASQFNENITIKTHCPKDEYKDRRLTSFLSACELILKLAHLNPKTMLTVGE
jgi:hypothetical protein